MPFRVLQMVRMAKIGLAPAPMLILMKLTTFWVSLSMV